METTSIGSAVRAQWNHEVQLVIGGEQKRGELPKTPCIERVPDEEGYDLHDPVGHDDYPSPAGAVWNDLGTDIRQWRFDIRPKN